MHKSLTPICWVGYLRNSHAFNRSMHATVKSQMCFQRSGRELGFCKAKFIDPSKIREFSSYKLRKY